MPNPVTFRAISSGSAGPSLAQVIAALYPSGSDGAVYELSDLASVWQESPIVTAGAIGSSAGVVRDQRVTGSRLVANLGGAGYPNELTARYTIPNAAESINWSVAGALTIVAGGYFQNDATSGRNISVPDSVANSVTGDIDIRMKVALVDWTPTSTNILLAKYTGTVGTSSYEFYVQSTGRPALTWSDGAAAKTASATVAPTVADGADLWLRVTLDVDNGAAGNTATFYTSVDGVAWTQLGATVTAAGVTTINDSATALVFGALSTGTSAINGKFYYAEIRSGIGGTVVSQFDGSAIAAAASGSWFQLASDSKYYTLNDTSGTTVTGNAVQATAGSRPIDTAYGSSTGALFDGIDDSMASSGGGGSTTGFFLCCAVKVIAGDGASRSVWSDVGTNTGYRVRLASTNKLALGAGNGSAFTSATTTDSVLAGNTYVLTVWDDGVNLNAQVNLGAVASTARPVVSAGGAGFTLGKDANGSTAFSNMALFEMFYRKNGGVSDSDRLKCQRYCAAKAGISI